MPFHQKIAQATVALGLILSPIWATLLVNAILS